MVLSGVCTSVYECVRVCARVYECVQVCASMYECVRMYYGCVTYCCTGCNCNAMCDNYTVECNVMYCDV